MKDKKVTGLLLLGVLIVWGLIVYRIIKSVGSDESVTQVAVVESTFKVQEIDTTTSGYKLKLSYEDPFLKNVQSKLPKKIYKPVKRVEKRNPVIKKEPQVQVPQINWSMIKYSGSLQNKKNGQLVALMQFFGQPLTLSEGEEKNGLLIRKIHRDSVEIKYSGEKKTILK